MKIEFEIDEELVIKAAEESAKSALTFPNSHSQLSQFHQKVRTEVHEQLASDEVKEKIMQVVGQRMDGIITDIVTQELRLHVKKAAKQMRESGGLANFIKAQFAVSEQ